MTNWHAFSHKTGIKIEWLDKELPNEATDIEAYTWSENHKTQQCPSICLVVQMSF